MLRPDWSSYLNSVYGYLYLSMWTLGSLDVYLELEMALVLDTSSGVVLEYSLILRVGQL